MKIKWLIFAVLVSFLVSAANSEDTVVNASEIEKVRAKGVLNDADFQVIDDFLAEAVGKLISTKDFTSISRIRTEIVLRNRSTAESAQAQYTKKFSESSYKYISQAFRTASGLTPEDRKFKTTLNLLILIDKLEDLRLTELVMKMLDDKSTVIRYWAVHSITNPGITVQLNSGNAAGTEAAQKIAAQLAKLVKGAQAEILVMIADFAAGVKIPQGEELLLNVADERISRYAGWTADYELSDADILKHLYEKMGSAGTGKAAVARRFGQLYSYVMQKYIKGQNFLSDADKQRLASVLVEIEKNCIGKLLEQPQSTIRIAIEQGNYNALSGEYSKLFGDETSTGQLALKLNFDYGQEGGGRKRMAPLVLPDPPQSAG